MWFSGESGNLAQQIAKMTGRTRDELYDAAESITLTRQLIADEKLISDLHGKLKELSGKRGNPLIEQAEIAARAQFVEDQIVAAERQRSATLAVMTDRGLAVSAKDERSSDA
jgi:hypothetical protein